jgi:hypothetical protein
VCHSRGRRPEIRLARYSQTRRRPRLNFQRCGSELDGALAPVAGDTDPEARGLPSASGGPALARRAGGRGASAGGGAGGQSRAWSTTPRIRSNHPLAPFGRPRLRPAGLCPGWFWKRISNCRLIITHLSLWLWDAQGKLARDRPGRPAQTRSPAAALDRASASEHEIMHNTNPMQKHTTIMGTSEGALVNLRP